MAAVKNDFSRLFLIFDREDHGHGTGNEPSGYVKIEIRDGKGKLACNVQYLRNDSAHSYRLYLMATKRDSFNIVDAGHISASKDKGELKWEFEPRNVGGSGLHIDSFNIFAIINAAGIDKTGSVGCPLAVYRNGKAEWREQALKRLISTPGVRDSNKVEAEKAPTKIPVAESKYYPDEVHPEFNIPDKARDRMNSIPDSLEPLEKFDKEAAESNEFGRSKEFAGHSADELIKSSPCGMKPSAASDVFCPAGEEGTAPGCSDCPLMARKTLQNQQKTATSIERLKSAMNRCFERYDPFRSKRKDYSWWKINSPVNLNNTLYQCGIKTPLLFNPALMMAHFKYRHLIAGIYTDKDNMKEYIVCGVPGVYHIDERPFGELCRWAQTEGTKPRYGAFGYWLVYMDPETGKFLDVQ